MSEHEHSCQQFELYAAEAGVPRGRQFDSIEEIQRFVNDLRDNWWWETNFSHVLYVEVGKPEREGRGSCGDWFPASNAGRIEMSQRAGHWCELVVLHEMSHVLAKARYGSESHDPWFARTYLELVYLVMGPDAYAKLETSFNTGGIEHDLGPEAGGGRGIQL